MVELPAIFHRHALKYVHWRKPVWIAFSIFFLLWITTDFVLNTHKGFAATLHFMLLILSIQALFSGLYLEVYKKRRTEEIMDSGSYLYYWLLEWSVGIIVLGVLVLTVLMLFKLFFL